MDFGPLVSPDWLTTHYRDPDLRIIDFRWSLDRAGDGHRKYRSRHLPGAVFVDLEALTGPETDAGRHPLPSPRQFEQVMRASGVSNDSIVVVYDDSGGGSAPRLWWLLHHFGHKRVAVLDGGLHGWLKPLTHGEERNPEGNFTAGADRTYRAIDYETLRASLNSVLLLDARTAPRYRGDDASIDKIADHIPGARNSPWRDQVDHRGFSRTPLELRQHFTDLGFTESTQTVVYCGSGVSACAVLLAITTAGLGGAWLYAGSWSDWSTRRGATIQTGTGCADPS